MFPFNFVNICSIVANSFTILEWIEFGEIVNVFAVLNLYVSFISSENFNHLIEKPLH